MCPQAHYHAAYVFCPCKILIFRRQARKLRPELLLIKARYTSNVRNWCGDYLRSSNHCNLFIFLKHLCQHPELSGAVMVRCTSHYDYKLCIFRQFFNNSRCRNHFIRVPYRSNLFLMKNISAHANQIRLFFFRNLNHIFKAVDCILGPKVHSLLYWAFELSDMPVRRM